MLIFQVVSFRSTILSITLEKEGENLIEYDECELDGWEAQQKKRIATKIPSKFIIYIYICVREWNGQNGMRQNNNQFMNCVVKCQMEDDYMIHDPLKVFITVESYSFRGFYSLFFFNHFVCLYEFHFVCISHVSNDVPWLDCFGFSGTVCSTWALDFLFIYLFITFAFSIKGLT